MCLMSNDRDIGIQYRIDVYLCNYVGLCIYMFKMCFSIKCKMIFTGITDMYT